MDFRRIIVSARISMSIMRKIVGNKTFPKIKASYNSNHATFNCD